MCVVVVGPWQISVERHARNCNAHRCVRRDSPSRAQAASFWKFINHRHLDIRTHPVGLLRSSDQLVTEAAIYTTHNKYNSRISMPLAGFEPAIPAMKRLQTYALKRKATGIDLAL